MRDVMCWEIGWKNKIFTTIFRVKYDHFAFMIVCKYGIEFVVDNMVFNFLCEMIKLSVVLESDRQR